MGLKLFLGITVMIIRNSIKIRPLWDWNSSNGSKIVGSVSIKIRPLWDWNIVNSFVNAPDINN